MKFAFRKVLPPAIPAILLNILFLWTSQMLTRFQDGSGHGFSLYMNGAIGWMVNNAVLFPLSSGLIPPKYSGLVSIDLVSLACLISLFVLTWRSSTMLRALQVASLMVMILPMEVLTGEPQQFFWHVMTFQVTFGILPGFTNADLFVLALFVLSASTLLQWRPSTLAQLVRALKYRI